MTRRRTALLLIPVLALLVVASETGLAADDRVFYGLIGLFVVSQVAWLAYVFRRQRQENYAQMIRRKFPDD